MDLFEEIGQKEVPGLQANAKLYKNKKHGFQYLHVENNDVNNFFAISFQACPEDNKGEAHVLEHMILHGSKKYPTDAFMGIDKRSINTFLNAFTSNDMIMFPMASNNEVDFHNCMDVYLDAVFFPLLDQNDFLSECHHLEFSEKEDPNSNLIHAGVVYNEMKGCMSSGDDLINEFLYSKLLEGTTYQYIFGGNPEDIIKLTRQDLVNFHDKYFHPSNCTVFHFGSFSTEKIMNHVCEYVDQFEIKPKPIPPVKMLPDEYKEPKVAEIRGPLIKSDNPDKQIRVSESWIIGSSADSNLVMDFRLLDSILTQSSASPLFKSLIKSEIGTDFIGGLDTYCLPLVYSVTLKGVSKEGLEKFEKTLFDTLQNLVDYGIDKSQIEASLNKMNIRGRKLTFNNGLTLYERIASAWMHGTDVLSVIDISEQLNHLKERISQPNYLENLIKEKLLNNINRIKFAVIPDEKYLTEKSEKDAKELKEIKEKMSEEETKACIDKSLDIVKALEEAATRVDTLPLFHRSDLDPKRTDPQYSVEENIYKFPTGTNGISQIDITVTVPIKLDIIKNLSLITDCIECLGSKEVSDEAFSQMKVKTTQKFGFSSFVRKPIGDKSDNNEVELVIRHYANCIEENFDDLLKIEEIAWKETNFDNTDRLRLEIQRSVSNINEALSGNGHSYASMYAARGVNRSNAINELMNGVTMLRRYREAEKSDINELSSTLRKQFNEIMAFGKIQASIHAQPESIDMLAEKLQKFVKSLSNSESENKSDYSELDAYIEEARKHKNIKIVADLESGFVGLATAVPDAHSPQSGDLEAAAQLLTNELLIHEVRNKLGAYGVFASYNGNSSAMRISTYWDGNTALTHAAILEVLRSAPDAATQAMVDAAVVKASADDVFPVEPESNGLQIFARGETPSSLQAVRDRIHAVSADSAKAALSLLASADWSAVIIGPGDAPEGFEKEEM